LGAAFGLAARFAVVLGLALAVVFFAAGFLAAVVRLAVVLRAGAAPPVAFIDLAAVVSCSAAVTMALVAVFIAFMAVFIACAEVVAFVAACVILLAADDTFVAADETLVAAAAGVTLVFPAALVVRRDLVVVVLLAAVFRAPLVFFVRLAGDRRVVERVMVFVGTDPSPRVDQLREDPFHNQRRATRRPGARRFSFPRKWSFA
jgi:hypothetical protein